MRTLFIILLIMGFYVNPLLGNTADTSRVQPGYNFSLIHTNISSNYGYREIGALGGTGISGEILLPLQKYRDVSLMLGAMVIDEFYSDENRDRPNEKDSYFSIYGGLMLSHNLLQLNGFSMGIRLGVGFGISSFGSNMNIEDNDSDDNVTDWEHQDFSATGKSSSGILYYGPHFTYKHFVVSPQVSWSLASNAMGLTNNYMSVKGYRIQLGYTP